MAATAMMKAETKAPFWLKASGGAASVAMLLSISSYNVWPTLLRVHDGERTAVGLAVVQISFTVILAIIPFVPGWNADTRKWLTIAFMLGNGWFAYENAGHRHDGERTAHNQHEALKDELAEKKDAREKLGYAFTNTDDSQVEFAQKTADDADADKARARASADAARAKFAACEKGCTKIDQEAKRLEAEAKQKDDEAKTAHDELQKLSGWRTLTKQAAPINARIDFLQEKLGSEKFVSDTSSNSEAGRTVEAVAIAFLIELGNRFGPEAVFKFIFFAAGVPLLLSSRVEPEIEVKPATRKSERPEISVESGPGNDAPAPPRKRQKQTENGGGNQPEQRPEMRKACGFRR